MNWSTSRPAAKITYLRSTHGPAAAVNDVSLSVAEGEIFGIIEANGRVRPPASSASAGLRTPDAGTVRLLGPDPQADRTGSTSRRGAASAQRIARLGSVGEIRGNGGSARCGDSPSPGGCTSAGTLLGGLPLHSSPPVGHVPGTLTVPKAVCGQCCLGGRHSLCGGVGESTPAADLAGRRT